MRFQEQSLGPAVEDDPTFYDTWGPPAAVGPDAGRLPKLKAFLARCGVCSRSEARALVRAERVLVNGRVADGDCVLDPQDRVTVNGQAVALPPPRIWVYNKPPYELDFKQPPFGDMVCAGQGVPNPTAICYLPTAIGYPPTAIVGRIGHSQFFFFFITAPPAGGGGHVGLAHTETR